MENYLIEVDQPSVIVKEKREMSLYRYVILKNGKQVGYLQTIDKNFIQYLYGLGLNIKQVKFD
ncbi:MAG TPA: hypothetical protein VGD26_04525 [Chitinophagaceae bacterium]|jgi:hypothetical protein